jgi:SAM-dependent methyltransferase
MGQLYTREQRLLAQLNSKLPPGVDWKSGAVRYVKAFIKQQGAGGEWYLNNKPFCLGPDFSAFVDDLSRFVAMVQTLRLPQQGEILDVGCGPGWVCEYFARLGQFVMGIDICDDMISVARQRLSRMPLGTLPVEKQATEFLAHDIESSPVPVSRRFDVAYFESTLHHFYNPVAVLRNVAQNLKEDGVIAILEGEAPPIDSEGHQKLTEVMAQYQTIERPYSREQLIELLAVTGFEYHRFYFPLCGLYEQTEETAETLRNLVSNGGGWNVVIASQTPAGLTRLTRPGSSSQNVVVFGSGFHAEERDPGGRVYHWSRGQGFLRLRGPSPVSLTVGTFPPSVASRDQVVRVFVNGHMRETCILTKGCPEHEIVLDGLVSDGLNVGSELRFESDCLFFPEWFGLHDGRPLSFWIRVEAD